MSECCIQLQEYYETIVNNKRSSKVFDEVQNTYLHLDWLNFQKSVQISSNLGMVV